MYPLVRFLKVALRGLFARRRLGVREESVLTFRVWPGDLDVNGHVNGGRYLTYTDLGRFDLIFRTGLFRAAMQNRWLPVIAAAHIEYRRELRLFQKFRLTTRILGWDDRWFYIEHEIYRREKRITYAVLRTAVRSRDGPVPSKRIAEALAIDATSPPLPGHAVQALAPRPEPAA